jgi:hypothetical protein
VAEDRRVPEGQAELKPRAGSNRQPGKERNV